MNDIWLESFSPSTKDELIIKIIHANNMLPDIINDIVDDYLTIINNKYDTPYDKDLQDIILHKFSIFFDRDVAQEEALIVLGKIKNSVPILTKPLHMKAILLLSCIKLKQYQLAFELLEEIHISYIIGTEDLFSYVRQENAEQKGIFAKIEDASITFLNTLSTITINQYKLHTMVSA